MGADASTARIIDSPTTVADAVAIKAHFGANCRFVVGCSEVAIEQRFRSRYHDQYVSLQGVPSLCRVARSEAGLDVGGACPLNDVSAECKRFCGELSVAEGAPFEAAHQRVLRTLVHRRTESNHHLVV